MYVCMYVCMYVYMYVCMHIQSVLKVSPLPAWSTPDGTTKFEIPVSPVPTQVKSGGESEI